MVKSGWTRHGYAAVLAAALAVFASDAMAQGAGSTRIADGTEPAWSPDGRWLLISVLIDDQRDLFVVRPDGSERRRITDTPESELLATWSPEGRIAFVAPAGDRLRLFVMEAPLEESRRSHAVQVPGHAPAFTSAPWTPDGRALTVVIGERPDLDIYRVPIDGTPPTLLVGSPGYDGSPAWSGDGRLAFVSDRNGTRDVWVLRQDGRAHPVTTTSSMEDSPAWSPDGRWIAFVSDRSGNREIYAVPAEGGSATRLTSDAAWAGYPTWSPDGSTLAYVLVNRGRGNDQLMTVAVPARLRARQ